MVKHENVSPAEIRESIFQLSISETNYDQPVHLVADILYDDGCIYLNVVPFRGDALPQLAETSQHYASRLRAYGEEHIREQNSADRFEVIQHTMTALGRPLMQRGLRHLTIKVELHSFTQVRTMRLFAGSAVTRTYFRRSMIGWTWDDDAPDDYNGDGWASISAADTREMQNALQDGINGLGAFALFVR